MSTLTPHTETTPVRVIHYVDPAPRPLDAELVYFSPKAVAQRHHEHQIAYARWAKRQAEIAASDRKMRRFWLGAGAVFALVMLVVLAVGGLLLYQAIAGLSLGLLAIPLVLLGGGLLVAGGHKCVTVIQHWH